ncbi:MAG: SpoIIE family protein phosphatase [Bacteroidales bacterium]|nr:SpoIIE family protein phosphatase [Bacteroidales bacterium]
MRTGPSGGGNRYRWGALLMLLLFSFPAISQTYYFDRYGVNEGLAASKVYALLQDSNDYLWMGIASGVSRFGGKAIENFSAEEGLATGGVRSMYEDSSGNIWFGHLDGGISLYDGRAFIRVQTDTGVIGSDITSIREIYGRMWFTTRFDGTVSAEYDPSQVSLVNIRQYKGAEGVSDQVSDSYIAPDGSYYCIADVGIKRYNVDIDRFEAYRPEGLTSYFNIIVMYEDSRGDRWFGTHMGGLYRMSADGGGFTVYDIRDGLTSNWISSITEDSRGRIWVGTWGGGITLFDGDDIRFFDNTNGLDAMYIQTLLEDREGNMIIASQYDGIHIFKGDHFVNYISDILFTDKNVMAVEEDRFNRIWFGTNDGITIYDPDNLFSWHFNSENSDLSDKVRFILSDRIGEIHIGTYGDGIYSYDFSNNRFIRRDDINDILYQGDLIVTALATDSNNNLWIGTNDGVALWETDSARGRRYTRLDGLSGLGITALEIAGDGTVWIGTERDQGLTGYSPESGEFRIVDIGYDLEPTTLASSSDGMLWVGTTFGLLGVRNDSVVLHLTQDDGLLSNNISLIQPCCDDELYIGTNLGLNRYNRNTGAINTYTRKNGFIGIETKRNASVTDSRGNIWFGTGMGATRLNPELIPEPGTEPLTHIREMRVNLQPREMKEGLKLSWKDKSVVFDYYSVCLTNPAAVRYQYMLEGADEDWMPETEHTQAAYSGLKAGRYTFKLKAVNSDGVWNDTPVSLSFIIKPPFYYSPLFITLMLIILTIAVIFYIKIRERQLVTEKRILEEKVEERTAEVVQKSQEIEEKNRDITASIRYAERIQMAMLPPEDSFRQTFVLFRPKDIVSGDFYWMHDNGDYQFIAAVDCTGHGVPGAFMSIIGFNSLTKIVREYGITRPAAILDQLNIEVTKSLLQRGEKAIKDGMDLALVARDKATGVLEYSGAYNPLIIVRDGRVETIRADRFPIGMSYTGERRFSNHEIKVGKDDMIYLCTDGFSDQFGGPEGKKFKSGNLKQVFATIAGMPVTDQREYLVNLLDEWMGTEQQVDDILIIGTRIP